MSTEEALKKIKQEGIKRKQVGLELDCSPLEGPNTTFWSIFKNGKKIGKVTSAVYSPRLKKNIALAMVEIDQSGIGNNLKISLADFTSKFIYFFNSSTPLNFFVSLIFEIMLNSSLCPYKS